MVEAGLHRQLLERLGHERNPDLEPGEPEGAARLQIDLLEGGGQVVVGGGRVGFAELLGEGDRLLAGGPECGHRLPDLLGVGQADT